MEPNNIADKYAVCLHKNETIVGHLTKGKTSRFAKAIFFFLRANEFNSCVTEVKGNRITFEIGRVQVPCKVIIVEQSKFISILTKLIIIAGKFDNFKLKIFCHILFEIPGFSLSKVQNFVRDSE